MIKYRINKAVNIADPPTYRGAGVYLDSITLNDLEDLRNWGANLIRINVWAEEQRAPTMSVDYILQSCIPYIILILDKCDSLGMKAVIALIDMPGGRNSSTDEHEMYYDATHYNTFIAIWKEIAKNTNIKSHPALYAYGILNEPVFKDRAVTGFKRSHIEAQKEAIDAIRVFDSATLIAVACNDWDSPWIFGNASEMSAFDAYSNLIYEFHMYEPYTYTHQGVANPLVIEYPGYHESRVDKNWLEKGLESVINWQKANPGKKIYVGEFSTICWSLGGAQWLEDCMSLFEKYQWDWTYHIFREYKGWSVEHAGTPSSDPNSASFEPADDTDRMRALKKYLRLNGMKSLLINRV